MTSRFLRIVLVCLVAAFVYANTPGNQFVYDDGAQVLKNHYIRDASHLREIWTTNVWSFMGPHAVSNYYRPVMHMVYMADYALFGYHPAGYHATSILLHALNAVLVLLLGEALLFASFKSPEPRPGPALAGAGHATATVSLVAALLFAVHPMATEAVAWAAGIPEVTYTFFFLLACWLYVKARPMEVMEPAAGNGDSPEFSKRSRLWLAGSVVAGLLALFSKETGLMLLPCLAVYEHLLRRSPQPQARRALAYAGHAGAVLFYLAMRIYSLGGFQVATNPYGVLTPSAQLFSTAYLFGKYMWKLVWPVPFNIFHVFYPAHSLLDWRALAGFAVAAAMAIAAYRLRAQRPGLAFALLVLTLPLAPAMDMRAIGHNVFTERYLYLPIAGFAWLVAAGLAYVWQFPHSPRLRTAGRFGSLVPRLLAAGLLVALLASYARVTRARNREWHDDLTLYSATLTVSPDSNLIRDNLGKSYLDGYGKPEAALAEFLECIRRAPDRAEYYYDAAQAYGELRRYDEALAALEQSLRLWPNYPEAFLARGDIYRELGNPGQAELEYRRALEIKPTYAEVHCALGMLQREQGKTADAERSFRRALEITDLADAHLNLGLLFLEQHRFAEAAAGFRHALISQSNSVVAWHGLGKALSAQGRPAEAARCFRTALNERKYAHPRRLGRVPSPDAAAIERDLQGVLRSPQTT